MSEIFPWPGVVEAMISYAKVTEENGVIVALDQEKAYDKVNHAYLIQVLRHLNFPESFINTIKFLYEPATTRVMVNGELSEPFQVNRGVR